MEQKETWVTALDNPFDPWEQREEWKSFDEDHGYFTTSLIARIASIMGISNEMSQDAFLFQVEQAVDEICRFNLTGNYRKVVKEG